MRFFLDNCLSPRYAQALHALSERDGHEVVHLREKFARDATLGPGWMNLSYWVQIGLLLRWWPSILDQARLVEKGTGFEVPYRSSGRFKLIR